MYFLSGIFLLLCALFLVIFQCRKRHIIRRICSMELCEKVRLLDELLSPFGFYYCCSQDIITASLDAWQREFGYGALFDRTAPHFNMIFDCEPVYFDYNGQTWLIEFWKGEYGMNTGGEIGIYCADRLLSPAEYEETFFQSADDCQLLPVSMSLFHKGKQLFTIHDCHWWLTGFSVGHYSEPEDLTMRCSVTFPGCDMAEAFVQSLLQKGYSRCSLCWSGLQVSFTLSAPHSRQPVKGFHYTRWIQWKNRLFCRLYQRITHPFDCTLDKILYLYFYLPFAFRHSVRFRKNKRQKCRRNSL